MRRHRFAETLRATMFAAVAAIPLLAAQDALAARPDTRAMTCAAAQEMVRRAGAVVMTTGRWTYERIVASVRYCDYQEEAVLFVAPTLDNPRCRVGRICRPAVLFEDFFDGFRRNR
jgi:hypothetical protein